VLEGIKTALFDFEGTLVSLEWKIADGEADLAKELRKMQFTENDLDFTKGYDIVLNRAITLAAAGKSGFSSEEIKERVGLIYDKYDLDALARWQLLPRARDTLTNLKNMGLKLGLITNVGRKALREAMSRFDLSHIFDFTISRNDVMLLKPSGQGILAALSSLGTAKNGAVFIGDSVSDIFAAKDAGIKVISLLGGQCSREELSKYCPDYIISSIDKIVKKLY
jgi:HAD superfamily hydrolase (TIGR01549 family)